MHLLSVIAAGIPAAANGRAYLYKRGTSTAATWYANYDGSGAVGTGYVTLDSYGGAEAYVNEHVDVEVQDANAAVVRSFTQMCADSAIEVLSSSFTGTDYVSGATGASKPAILQAIFDLWYTNNGARDWKVKVGATSRTLPAWLTDFSGLFFNPLSPDYGAVGDSTTDDTSALQACITAAAVAGGTVIISRPHKTSAALTVPAGVSVVGTGPDNAKILLASGAGNIITYTGANLNGRQELSGLTIGATQANNGNHVYVNAAGTRLVIDNCAIGGANTNGCGVYVGNATADVTIRDCSIISSASLSALAAYGGKIRVYGGRIRPCAGLCNAALIDATACDLMIERTLFDNSNATSGTVKDVWMGNDANTFVSVSGCVFTAGGGTSVTQGIVVVDAPAGRVTTLREIGNKYLCTTALKASTSVLGSAGSFTLTGRDSRTEHKDRSADLGPTLDPLNNAASYIHATHSSDCVITVPGPHYPGQRYTIYYYNGTGAPRTLDTNVVGAATTVGIPDSVTEEIPCIAMDNAGSLSWVLYGAKVALS